MTDLFLQRFKAARRVGTSLMAVQTPDLVASVNLLRTKAIGKESPIILWDVCRGWTPGNEAGKTAITEVLAGRDPVAATGNPVECLLAAEALADPRFEKAILFMFNAHRYYEGAGAGPAAFIQALCNLREPFKGNLCSVVLLVPQAMLPVELASDVLVLDEPLPTAEELTTTVTEVLDNAGLTGKVKPPEVAKAVDALLGLASFPAEQAAAMAVTKAGLDPDVLWERKQQMIAATPGLSVWRGGETFEQVGGNEQVKTYLRKLMKGRATFNVVVFLDEIEKQLAGATGIGDSSGVSQAQHGALLTYMQDKNVRGLRFIGPPGAGKSAVAKAIGAEHGVLTIALDMGGMKGSLVGESEQRLRTALKVIDAVGGGRSLFVATCNRDAALSPELRRRFPQTFFFDLPDAAERAAIWQLYRAKYDLGTAKQNPAPPDDGWTGAEIRTAAMHAWDTGDKLADAAQYIVPVAKAAAEEIEALRRQAEGRFLSASYPGLYRRGGDKPVQERVSRRMEAPV